MNRLLIVATTLLVTILCFSETPAGRLCNRHRVRLDRRWTACAEYASAPRTAPLNYVGVSPSGQELVAESGGGGASGKSRGELLPELVANPPLPAAAPGPSEQASTSDSSDARIPKPPKEERAQTPPPVLDLPDQLQPADASERLPALPELPPPAPRAQDNGRSRPDAEPRWHETFELLPLIDVNRDRVSGVWRRVDGKLESNKQRGARIEIPYQPPEEYVLQAIAEPLDDPNTLILGQRLGGNRFQAMLHCLFAGGAAANALEDVDGRNVTNSTFVRRDLFRKGRPSNIVCVVRNGQVTVTCDGRELISWRGKATSLGPNAYWTTPRQNTLFLGAQNCRYRIHRLCVTPISGTGKQLLPAYRPGQNDLQVPELPELPELPSEPGQNDLQLPDLPDLPRQLADFPWGKVWGPAVAISPDGRWIAADPWRQTSQRNKTAEDLFGPSRDLETPPLPPLPGAKKSWAIELFDVQQRRKTDVLIGGEPSLSLGWSPDGKTLASGGYGQKIFLWDMQKKGIRWTVQVPDNNTRVTRFSPDGSLLATAGSEKVITLREPSTGEPLKTLEGHTGLIASAVFFPDGKRLASTGADGTVRIWDVESGEALHTWPGGVQQLITLALSPDESLLAATGLKGSVVIWDVPNQKLLHTLDVSGREIWGVLFSQDSRRLLSSGGNGTIVVWHMETGKRLYAWKAHSTWIRFMGMFPDGKHLCTASLGDNRIRVWEVTP